MRTSTYPVFVILWLLANLHSFRYTNAAYFGPNFNSTPGSTHRSQDTLVVTFNNPSHVLETGCLTEFRYFAHAGGLMSFIITQPMTNELNQTVVHVTNEVKMYNASSRQTYYVLKGIPVKKNNRFGFVFYPRGYERNVPITFDNNTGATLYEVHSKIKQSQLLTNGTSLHLAHNLTGNYRFGVYVDLTDINCTSRRSSTTPVTRTSYSTSSPGSSSLTPTASTNPAPQNETLMYSVIGSASGAVLIALIICVTVFIIRRSRTAKSGSDFGPDGGFSNLSLGDMPTSTEQTSVAPPAEGDQDMYSKPVKRVTNTPDVIPSQLTVTPNDLYEESTPPIPAKSDDIESSMPMKEEESSIPAITINGDDVENRTSDYTAVDDNGAGSNLYNEYSTGADTDYADYGNNTHDYDVYDVETRPRELLGAELNNDYEQVSRATSGEYSYCDATPTNRRPSFSSNQYEIVS